MVGMTGERYDETWRALRALASPLSIGSLVLLVLNDHVLKQAWPGWVTGKLSDVVGLVVAPLVLAVPLAALRVSRPHVVAVLLTGVGFGLVKATGTGAAVATDAWSAVAGPSYLRQDVTDLLALPALLVALRAYGLAENQGPPLRRRAAGVVGALVLPFAVLATAATSPCDDGDYGRSLLVMEGRWEQGVDGWDRGQRFVYNGEFELRPVPAGIDARPVSEQERFRMEDDLPWQSHQAACDPERPRLCWQTSDPDGGWGGPDATEVGYLVVYASEDGGRTWTEETVLGTDEVERLRDDAGEVCGKPLKLGVGALAVMSTEGGPVVAVTLTNAGVAFRDVEGSWSRLSHDEISDQAVRNTPPSRSAAPYRDPLKAAGRHPITPVEVVTPVTESPTPTPSYPTPTGPPCERPSLVTVTPDPRNGPASTRLRCPVSTSPPSAGP
jgi:hypothetical protein